jgi:hypothetical protein
MSNVVQFKRASARPASNPCNHRVSPSLPMGNCEAGLSSGMSPDAAPGGTRKAAAVIERSTPSTLDDRYFWRDMCVIVGIGMAIVGLMTVLLL